ncbi:MAG: hypothetical protein M0P74_00935 [Syntrophales bacterium]|jgi:hypothetical protein|nr:hypothetical protein [Syntrophales bacterium]
MKKIIIALLLLLTVTPLYAETMASFSGSGQSVTSLFRLRPGLYIFDLTVTRTNSSNFIVHLIKSDGTTIDYLTNLIVAGTHVTVSATITKDDYYLLDIDLGGANQGAWVATVTTAAAIPYNYYTKQELDQSAINGALQERARWDVNGDNKIGLEEAIRALQIISGMR